MKNLTDVYNQVAAQDAELEKQASVMIKQAEEEDAAGRICARGFADELHKLAEGYSGGMNVSNTGPKGGQFGGSKTPSVKSGPYSTGGGNTGANYDPMAKGRGAGASQNAAQQAGGSSNKVVGAPPMKPMSAKPAPTKPPGGLASMGGGMKPPGA